MLKRNKENGVTLIALVVTIIVLLILAGISIGMLTGENGILTNAQKAKVETRGATVEESRDIWKATKETDKLANSETAQSLEELINELVKQKQLTEDEKDIILGNEEKGIEAEYKITIGSRTIEFIKIIDFSIEGETYNGPYNASYSVEEGTSWNDFLAKNFPNDLNGWMYETRTGKVIYSVEENGYVLNVDFLTNASDEYVTKEMPIQSRKILFQ